MLSLRKNAKRKFNLLVQYFGEDSNKPEEFFGIFATLLDQFEVNCTQLKIDNVVSCQHKLNHDFPLFEIHIRFSIKFLFIYMTRTQGWVCSSNCEPECLMPSEYRYKAQIRY